ncbi:hypothetical protein C1E24_18145 [Pseudoalteromonas phenolica]|uniref:Uncharacterized protein n=1 Tax=Pseudoalteromonas phenolica TaxID=161398 RepID=A0A5R9PYD3_9GAMM|nr:hypothetical protein C1E24_18145 [Pseudoalteromonas phenolica]
MKISYLEQLNRKIFALLSTSFTCLKIDHLIKRIGITLRNFNIYDSNRAITIRLGRSFDAQLWQRLPSRLCRVIRPT